MYIDPPRRNLSRWVDGKGSKPSAQLQCKTHDAVSFVKSYRKVCERDGRTCQICGAPYLYSPKLKLGVRDPSQYIYDADNLMCLCSTCAIERDSAEQRLTAVDVTGAIHDTVCDREDSTCFYCLRGPMAKEHVDLVPRIDRANELDPNDWACSCRTCANKRGNMSHEDFIDLRYEEAEELARWLNSQRVIRTE